jgi:hypothetical protein
VLGLADLFRRLDELRAKQADRDSFFLDAGRLLHLASLSPEDEETAVERIRDLADDLPSHLITSDDLASAARSSQWSRELAAETLGAASGICGCDLRLSLRHAASALWHLRGGAH